MNTRILIVLVVIIVLLTVVAVVMGATRKESADDKKQAASKPPAYTHWLDRAFGWMSPGFDLDDLSVSGATLKERRLTLAVDQKVMLTVKAKPDADINSCRSLTLDLVSPTVSGPAPQIVLLDDITLKPPLPDGFDKPDTGQLLPNARLEPDPITKKIDPKKFGECAIPVFKGGAIIVLTAKRACTLEIR